MSVRQFAALVEHVAQHSIPQPRQPAEPNGPADARAPAAKKPVPHR